MRLIHLVLGLLATPALLVYGVTAIQLTLKPLKPAVSTQHTTLQLEPTAGDATDYARQLAEHGVQGALVFATEREASALELNLIAGAIRHDVTIAADGTTQVATHRGGLAALIHNLHLMSGTHTAYPAMQPWVHLSWVSGAALLGLIATGLFLWFKRPRDRRLGLLILLGNLLWGGGTALALRLLG